MKVIHLQVIKVASYDDEGMPKKEKAVIKLKEGFEFEKFLKYLPHHGYLRKETKVIAAFEVSGKEKKEIDATQFEVMLSKAFYPVIEKKQSFEDQLVEERKRNDELMKRLEALEAKSVKEVEEPTQIEDQELEALKAEYKELTKKNPDKRWSIETIKEKIEELK